MLSVAAKLNEAYMYLYVAETIRRRYEHNDPKEPGTEINTLSILYHIEYPRALGRNS